VYWQGRHDGEGNAVSKREGHRHKNRAVGFI
jgi:hypothetical protein